MAKPGALAAARKDRERQPYNADDRAKARENTPAVVGGLSFTRRRKDWKTSRAMRQQMREQENAVARGNRIRARIAELEVEQIEAAAAGEDEREAELEVLVQELVTKSDEATEAAELVTYRLLCLLLVPPTPGEGEDAWRGFGPAEADEAAVEGGPVEHFQEELDVEEAVGLARELTGSVEPDPPMTPSSENGSS